MSFHQPLWISPDGKVIRVNNHQWYANTITHTSPNDPDDDKAYNEMFRRGWIRGIDGGGILYLNNSFSTIMTTLYDLPSEQRKAIRDYSRDYNVWVANNQCKPIDMVDENMEAPQKRTNLKSKLGSLYAYMSRRLKIGQPPRLFLTNDPTNARQPFGFTGKYDNESKTIRVYITDRHPTDILRSFAHEIIHHWQNEHGQLGNETKPHYAQEDPLLRKKEMEAYLLGNIIFRSWQDLNRYGSPHGQPSLFSLDENRFRNIAKKIVEEKIINKIITMTEI